MTGEEAKSERYDRFVGRVEVPMLALAVVSIPVILMPFVENLSPESEQALGILGLVIWILFLIEYLSLIYLAPDRRHAISTHKLELALVLLPFLRPFQLARLARLAHAGTAFARATVAVKRLFGRPGFAMIIAVVAGCIVIGGGLVAIAEHGQTGSTVTDFGDGLWWAFVTCTTVGYGDTFPVTTTGRGVAVVLMLTGISGLSAVTANIAAYFVSADVEDEVDEVAERLSRIEAQLQQITKQLQSAED